MILIKPIIINAAEGLAFIFCILEAYIGYYFGIKAFEKKYSYFDNDPHYFAAMKEKILFYAFFGLMLTEFIGYIILGVFRKIGGYKNIDLLKEKDFVWLDYLEMFYFAPLGAIWC